MSDKSQAEMLTQYPHTPFFGVAIEWGSDPRYTGPQLRTFTRVSCNGLGQPIRIEVDGQMIACTCDPDSARDLADDLYAAANWSQGRDSLRRRLY